MEEDKFVCYECVEEGYLSKEIENLGETVNCSYCGNEDTSGYPLETLADRIARAFDQHYIRSSEFPPEDWSISRIKNMDYFEPDGYPVIEVIAEAAGIDEKIAQDVQEILADKYYDRSAAEIGESSEFNDESFYDIKNIDDIEWQENWANFEHNIKTKARFFNNQNETLLNAIFEGVDKLNTHEGKPVVRIMGPESDLKDLYRARVFQSDQKLAVALKSPDIELGPPPTSYANGGRMNARGISVFYGATNPDTALAEVRPPVGSKVTVARFLISRQLKVLDLSALISTKADGSIFDAGYAELLARTAFLRKLSQRMTRPIMPDDEHSEYLVTQVIADYLSSVLGLDGIIFPSAQSQKGLNVTLFYQASRVLNIENTNAAEIETRLSDWDGEEEIASYQVIKWLRNEKKKDEHDDLIWVFPGVEWKTPDQDQRAVSLMLDVESVAVEHIDSIEIKRTGYSVSYSEYTKPDRNFGNDFIDY